MERGDLNYHLDELRIALDSSDPSHILPPPLPLACNVLDLGCGAGQTLIAAYSDRVSFGLDIDFEAVRLGNSLTNRIRFTCGRAEALPYRSSEFDMVVARVSLAYTNIPASLKEIRRVLKKGGELWMTLHPFSIPWNQAKSANYKGKVFFAYVLLNSVLFHLLQRQFSFQGRCESFQTTSGMQRALRRNGFQDISVTRGAYFLVTAKAR